MLQLIILSFLAGSLIKIADDIEDKNLLHRFFAIPAGVGYGLLMGFLMLIDSDAALLFGGIVLGCLLTGKINSTAHYFGLGAILVLVFLYGVKLSLLVFPITLLAALDEMKTLPFPELMLRYRLFLKLGILALVILKVIGLNALIMLIAFDTTYIITERINARIT